MLNLELYFLPQIISCHFKKKEKDIVMNFTHYLNSEKEKNQMILQI
jgi:hypothetical protein